MNKRFRVFRVAIPAASLSLATSVFAAVPTGVTTGITDAAEDVATIGGIVILIYLGVKLFKWMRSAL